jgi:uncharacterized integral membrane protein
MRIRIRVLAAIVVMGLLLTFVLQNWQPTIMHFLGWKLPTMPLALYCLLIYLLGMFTGWALFSFIGRSLRQATSRPLD